MDKYYVIGPRNKWDTVLIGLFDSYEEAAAHVTYPAKKSIIREATRLEVELYARDSEKKRRYLENSKK